MRLRRRLKRNFSKPRGRPSHENLRSTVGQLIQVIEKAMGVKVATSRSKNSDYLLHFTSVAGRFLNTLFVTFDPHVTEAMLVDLIYKLPATETKTVVGQTK